MDFKREIGNNYCTNRIQILPKKVKKINLPDKSNEMTKPLLSKGFNVFFGFF